jgi:TonB-linked SusC/RagA family outer membrane protein
MKRNEVAQGAGYILSQLYNSRGRQAIYLPEEDTNYVNYPWSADLQSNAIQSMKEGGELKYHNQYFTGNANLQVKNVVKGLTLDLNVSRRGGFYAHQGDRRYLPSMGRNGVPRAGYDINNPNRVTKIKNSSYQDKLEALLNYDLQLGDHHFHALAGASYEQYLKDEITAEARNLLSNDFFSLNYYGIDLATNSMMGDAIQPWKMASLFGRLDYDFLGRYILQATIRYDGSSRLAPGNRWGAFPSVSGAWRISEESFFESIKPYVNSLKLRASWGQLGNSTVLNSMYYPYFGMISNKKEDSATDILSIMGNPVYYQKAMASTNVTWETVQTTNVGVDFGLLDYRLNLTADYYWKKNDGMLAQLRIGNIAGVVDLPYQNAGVLETRGWEVSVQWRDQIGDFSYHAGFNIEDSRNKLISYAGNNVIKAGAVKLLEGSPLNTIWGYQTDGFWSSRDEYLAYKTANPGYETYDADAKLSGGDVRYVAQGKADHKIGIGGGTPDKPGDLVNLGTSNARYLFGINLGASWKGIDFSMFWQGVGQRKFIINDRTLAPLGNSYEMPWTIHRDYWTQENPDAYFARPVEGQVFNYQPSDRWVQNGAYLRLKNIQLGYNIPLGLDFIKSFRVYVQGTDVLEFTNCLKVFDPEVGNEKNTQYYPFFRTWTLGVNLTF